MTAAAPPVHDPAPFLEALASNREQGMVSFSCPGHKGGQGAAGGVLALLGEGVFDHDVWLNTADHDRLRRVAESLAARTWGADRSFFLVNGSSSGNQAYLLAAVGPGDEVIVGRDLHKSLLVGLILTGARPVYVAPRVHPELGVGLGVAAADVAAALARHPAARLVTLVSPSHDGVASDLDGVVAAAHARGVPVYVDEAWGPHLGFHPALPAGAMAAGADGAVTSTHKFLSSLSQTSLLNVRAGRVDPARVATTVRMTQTTSPLLPLLASLDACRRQLATDGERLLDRAIELADDARRRLRMLPGLDVLGPDQLGLGPGRFDPLKLVVDTSGLGLRGQEAERLLRDRLAIAPDASDLRGVVCMVTIGDTRDSIDQFVGAFAALCAQQPARPAARALPPPWHTGSIPAQVLSPREAFFAPSRAVRLRDAVGEVAAELVVPYPPGIPVLVPGEVIGPEVVDHLLACRNAGVHICGPADPALDRVAVVTGERP